MPIFLSLILGGIFGLFAAFFAYLITYNEWVHHYPTKKRPRRIALEAALFAFCVFFFIALAAGFLM
jgi:TRAP-type C4-dicarboxylate transport system permease small subunit